MHVYQRSIYVLQIWIRQVLREALQQVDHPTSFLTHNHQERSWDAQLDRDHTLYASRVSAIAKRKRIALEPAQQKVMTSKAISLSRIATGHQQKNTQTQRMGLNHRSLGYEPSDFPLVHAAGYSNNC
jgi:hypothetical protein